MKEKGFYLYDGKGTFKRVMAAITTEYIELLKRKCTGCEVQFLCNRCYVHFAGNGCFEIPEKYCAGSKASAKKMLEDIIQVEEGKLPEL